MYNYYITLLGYPNIPEFLNKYLTLPSLNRLKDVGYFCGMDYASSNIYNFKEYISRYMHSLSTSLLVYYLTKDKRYTLQALFHDISTPVFSHVIDYMNKDYIYQETTEEFTELILKSDKKLLEYLELDKIPLDNLVNFKFSTIVDSPRPKMCADRLDGIILNGSYWTKTLNKKDIFNIIKSTELYINEESIPEIGFNNITAYNKVVETNDLTNIEMHSNYDNYMMELLANITRHLINKEYIKYEDLYFLTENKIFELINNIEDKEIKEYIFLFKNIKKEEIPLVKQEEIKERKLKPLLNGKRI
jgi:hypothetical protein